MMARRRAERTTATVKRDRKSGENTFVLTIENSTEERLRTLNQMMRVKRALSEATANPQLR